MPQFLLTLEKSKVEKEHLGGLGRDVKTLSSRPLLSVMNLGFGWAA